jgi:putative transposase
LAGVRLVISDAHEGLKAAIAQVFAARWQRCRVHFMRNLLACVPKASQSRVGTLVRQVFVPPDAENAQKAWRQVADQLRPRFPKAAELMDGAEADGLAHLNFPAAHPPKLHSTNPLKRLNKEVKRRANVVGIFPNEASLCRLIGAVLMEQNEEWLLQHCYLPQHTMADGDAGPAELASISA